MTDEKWWEKEPYMEKLDLYRSDDTSCEFYDIPTILAEHTRRIVAELEGMRRNGPYDVNYSYNFALDEAIKRIKEI